MKNESDSYRLNLILKKFEKELTLKHIREIEKYVLEYPNDLVGKYNYAVILEKNKKINEAKLLYNQIIKKKPDHWQSLTNLYLIYFHKNDFKKSLALVKSVLKLKPNYQPALRDKSHILYRLNKLDDALKDIIKSVKLNQKDFIAFNVMGMIYSELKQNKFAIQIYKKAISINPKYFPSYSNIAKSLYEENKIDEAINYLETCLKINPNFFEGINNLANIFTKTGGHKKAIKLYLNLLEKNRNHPDVNLNIAIAYFFDKNYDEAEKFYKIAKELDGNSDKFKKNYSLFLLFKQEYKEAWKIGEGRLKLQEFAIPGHWLSNFRPKIWQGEKISELDNILIVKEQGVGDEILYSSMYSEALEYFKNCKIEADERLLSIFRRSFNINTKILKHLSISKNKNELKNIDKVIFAFDLPRLFRNSLSDFKKNSQFLFAEKNIISSINKKLKKISNKKNIGIAWKSKREVIGKDKSINLNSFAPLIKLSNDYNFINLQYGNVDDDLQELFKKNNLKITTLEDIDLFNDFEKIAGLLVNLDLFITVSNTTAHLAGALNVPTWLIKPKTNAIFHYWNQPGSSSPWYSSIRLIEKNNDKKQLIKKLIKDLENYFN